MEGINYSEIVQTVLQKHTVNHLSDGTEKQLIFDVQRDRYLLVYLGWEHEKWAYGCVVHIEIKDGKVWIQRDLTEVGIGNELAELGIPKTDIILGFRSPYLRQFTGFGIG
ncbi:XisI protein [Roseofilum sp. BLCC_M154]|uniref:XisI protein n=1 Tax=Roseofilum acuticapitatum BLCC-M154 TaxID=3022444 RepID=A0ABT7AXX0_9CYAN|nr:XisI protein [Roseofilum acuticapitatum]MDJ1171141.1 XisI protein [Roseofilum acuticapitatum BLCC-M154]